MQNRHFAIYIAAAPEQVWHALTDPHLTPRFYFGLAVESDWQPGSSITFRGPGPAILAGKVVHVERSRRLVHSFITGADEAGPEAWMTWDIEESEPGICRVCLTHDDLERTSDPDQDEACLRLLSNLKTLLECGVALAARETTR